MRLVAVDLEMCQPSTRIIQIGAVCFQPDSGKVAATFNQLVDPHELISPEITNLTGITNQDVSGKPHIVKAAEAFTAFKSSLMINPIAIVWGAGKSNDVRKIYDESGIESPFKSRIIDCKAVFQMLANASPAAFRQQTGLLRACELLNLGWDELYGPPHNALADAYNTMRIYMFFSKCLKGAVDIKLG